MSTIDIRFSPRIYLPKPISHRRGFHSIVTNHSKALELTRSGRPYRPLLRRSPAVLCQSQSERSSPTADAGKPNEGDFVSRVLKENPSQVEPRYLIGDKFYTLKEKENLSKNSDEGIFQLLVKRLSSIGKSKKAGDEVEGGNGSEVKNEAVYLKDILREYRGKLYVPEQVFGTKLSEEEEFEKSLEALPKMSLEDFQKYMKTDKVKLLTWKEISGGSYGNVYRDFVVDLKEIPGDKSLQRTKWAMRLDETTGQTLLQEYTGPRYQIERSTLIALMLAVLISKIAQIDYPKQWLRRHTRMLLARCCTCLRCGKVTPVAVQSS